MREPWPNTASETRANRSLKTHVVQQGGVVQLVGEAAPNVVASPLSLALVSTVALSYGRDSRAHFEGTEPCSSIPRAYFERTSTAP